MIPGGEQTGDFDHNAIIPLPGGSYIELYSSRQISQFQILKKQNALNSITAPLNAIERRFINRLIYGEGLADFAFSAPDLNLDHEIVVLSGRNLVLTSPVAVHRVRADGEHMVGCCGAEIQ